MKNREKEWLVAPSDPHFVGNGFRMHNFIPYDQRLSRNRMDPFILLDYQSDFYFPPSEDSRGVGVHPHRGFETVTIVYKGKVAHHDSTGAGGVIGAGDVQWMTAGAGILHKEYQEENFTKEGGNLHMIQLWVNLPSNHKMVQPSYQGIKEADIPKVKLPGNKGYVDVIAGLYKNTKGAARTFSPMHVYNVHLEENGTADFSFPEEYSTAFLVIEGEVTLNNKDVVPQDHFILMQNKGTDFVLRANKESVVLMLSGEPLKEPMVAHGPFVMNTQQQLVQAFQDYEEGKFGYLKE